MFESTVIIMHKYAQGLSRKSVIMGGGEGWSKKSRIMITDFLNSPHKAQIKFKGA